MSPLIEMETCNKIETVIKVKGKILPAVPDVILNIKGDRFKGSCQSGNPKARGKSVHQTALKSTDCDLH